MSNNRDEYDQFGDIINSQAGIFGGDAAALEPGLTNFDSARTVPTPEGLVVEMSCRGCGRGVKLTIDYAELVAVKYGVPPQIAFRNQPNLVKNPTEWAYSPRERAWWPNYPCSHCRCPCAPLINAEEAERHLAEARRARWINPEGEQYAMSICSQVAAQQAAAAARR